MTREEYEQVQTQLDLLADLVNEMPLGEFLEMIGRADSIGIMVDPTAWIHGQETMHQFEALAQSARSFQVAAGKFLTYRTRLRAKSAASGEGAPA